MGIQLGFGAERARAVDASMDSGSWSFSSIFVDGCTEERALRSMVLRCGWVGEVGFREDIAWLVI